jgi:hypothetical protein
MNVIFDEEQFQLTIRWKSVRAALRSLAATLRALLPVLISLGAILAYGALRGWW